VWLGHVHVQSKNMMGVHKFESTKVKLHATMGNLVPSLLAWTKNLSLIVTT